MLTSLLSHRLAALGCLLLILAPTQGFAQRRTEAPRRPWVIVGLGAEYHQIESSFEVSANFERKYVYQIAYEFSGILIAPFTGEWFQPSTTGYSLHSLSAKIGVGGMRRWYAGGVFAGPALVLGRKPSPDRQPGQRLDEATDFYVTGGLGLGAELYFKPLRGIGAGVKLFANLNPVFSVDGYRFCLLFRIPRRDEGRKLRP